MDRRRDRPFRRGLALAAFENGRASGIGVTLDAAPMATLFGEDQGRYLVASAFDWPRN